jgi:translation initiation factor 1 (eIF-1/SUI1)
MVNPTSKKEFVEDINHNDVSGAVVDIEYEIESDHDQDDNDHDNDIEEYQEEDQVVQIMIEKRCAKKSLTIVQGQKQNII